MPEQTDVQGKKHPYADLPDNADSLLAIIVSSVNRGKLNEHITLLVQGLVITGEMISYDQYWSEFRTDDAESPEPRDEQLPLPRYIHLRNAQIVGPGWRKFLYHGEAFMNWRIKLSDVSGWIVGGPSIDF